jgi:hypothetical protein
MDKLIPLAQLIISIGMACFFYWCGRAMYEFSRKAKTNSKGLTKTTEIIE